MERVNAYQRNEQALNVQEKTNLNLLEIGTKFGFSLFNVQQSFHSINPFMEMSQ